MQNISPQETAKALKANPQALLIDVRSGKEYQTVHAAGAQLFPLDQITEETANKLCRGNKDTPLYVLCQSGVRAKVGSAQLDKMGFSKVYCVEGGTVAWEASGLPVERGQGSCFSLERQFRLTIGALVSLGVALGYSVHPVFFALSGFVGLGLLFAGLTDKCGLALLLARMPWNRTQTGTCCCSSEKTHE